MIGKRATVLACSAVAVVYGSAAQLMTLGTDWFWCMYAASLSGRFAYLVWKDGES